MARRACQCKCELSGSANQPKREKPKSKSMKVVLFCGGLGMRIRDGENVPKPIIKIASTNRRVTELVEREDRLGLRSLEGYASFPEKVKKAKRELLSFLIEAKNQGKRVCGYGAPGKGNTLLNYCGIGTDFLDFTVDRNPDNHGLYTPGMHIPIRPVEEINASQPDYILILPWNL